MNHPFFDITADLDTPVSAYLKLTSFDPCFLLESVEISGSAQGGSLHQVGRYSLIGLATASVLQLDEPKNPLADFRAALTQAPRLQADGLELPFNGGLVGVSAFDLVRGLDTIRVPRRQRPTAPDALYVAPKSLLVFDHVTRTAALLHDGSEEERKALRKEIIQALHQPVQAPASRGGLGPSTASMDKNQFLRAVGQAQEHISAGDVFQLVLSICEQGETDLDPFTVYRTLRRINPSPYMYFLDLPGTQIVGSSPEALVKMQGGEAILRPIAGTRPRGRNVHEDEEHEQSLLADPKEGSEHVMLVDLARNDLGRVATPGSIQVHPYRQVERYSHVMHLVSGVRGNVSPEVDQFDVFAATFPAGTVVGAPKLRAVEILESLEPQSRGFYAGTVGYFGHDRRMDQAIAIRTLTFSEGLYAYQAGAGIVAESQPELEYLEIKAKGRALKEALAQTAGVAA
jgi:anthranilate synthase component I